MGKQSGLGAALFVNEFDISGDIGAMSSMSMTTNLQDVTGLDKDGTERLTLRNDAEMSYDAFWNSAAGHSIPVLEPLEGAMATFVRGRTIGSPTRTLTGVKSMWTAARGPDGSIAANGQLQAAIGRPLEAGLLLTNGKQTFAATQLISAWTAAHAYSLNDLVQPTTPNGHYYKATVAGTSAAVTEPTWVTNGGTNADGAGALVWTDQGTLPNGANGIDRGSGVSTAFGAAGALHVISIGSGTATVKIQTSTNRTAWTDLITFTNVTAAGYEYKRTVSHTATVSRYLRCYVTNVFTSLVAAVAVMPYRSLQS
jgi:hypothetical protein